MPFLDNPTFTKCDDIVQPLRDIGVWEEFKNWVYKYYFKICEDPYDLLTTPDLLAQALHSFAEEVCGG
jgi:hypothetical protein